MEDELEGYFSQYEEQVGDNRIAPIMDELKSLTDPEEKMLLIMDALKNVEVVPDVGHMSFLEFLQCR